MLYSTDDCSVLFKIASEFFAVDYMVDEDGVKYRKSTKYSAKKEE